MIQPELIKFVIAALDRLGISYMITGSVAANAHGRARTTHDIDVVIELEPGDVAAFAAAFPSERFFLQEESIRSAISRGGMFNAIDEQGIGKIDFWTLTDDTLNQRAFERRIRVPFFDTNAWVPRPEDLILLKLQWSKLSGGSQRQMEDCAELLRFNVSEIDVAETEHWAMRSGVSEQWKELREVTGI